jgi:hypothetical protein
MELALLAQETAVGWPGAKAVLLNGAAGAFLPKEQKAQFMERYAAALEAAWAEHVTPLLARVRGNV